MIYDRDGDRTGCGSDHEAKLPLGELAETWVRYKSCMSGMRGPSKIGFGRGPPIEADPGRRL